MKKVLMACFVVAMGLMVAGGGYAGEKAAEGKPQTHCPVMGGEVKKDVFGDYEGKRVYFCCAACIDDFNKDPAKYGKLLEDQGVALAPTPAAEGSESKCPHEDCKCDGECKCKDKENCKCKGECKCKDKENCTCKCDCENCEHKDDCPHKSECPHTGEGADKSEAPEEGGCPHHGHEGHDHHDHE